MEPLAHRMRPQNLSEFVGQEHLVGEGRPLRIAIEKKHRFSIILWGPPGSGKTTLARIYAHALHAELHELSAVSASKDDIRAIMTEKTASKKIGKTVDAHTITNEIFNTNANVNTDKTSDTDIGKDKVLFLDEIHRFSKSQQDFLLPFVESGDLTLVGATTENPSFEVISPLLSRCRVFMLEPLSEESLRTIVARCEMSLDKDAITWLAQYSVGDARKALSLVESAKGLYGEVTVNTLKDALQTPLISYDKKGDDHYDTVSAFIKSMRASQGDAALYYLARMVSAGEDPLFIARRMVIFASEDIGLAQPTALVVANAVFRACETIGYPECTINLAHGAAYLAQCKKDRSAYDALRSTQKDVHTFGNLPIPKKIRNPVTKLTKDLKYGEGYEKYDTESYLPEKLKKQKYLRDSSQ